MLKCILQVDDVHAPVDRETNERRPFVFVTFESSSAAEEACDERNHTLGGKEVRTCQRKSVFSVLVQSRGMNVTARFSFG